MNNKCRYAAIKDFDINQSDDISVSLWMQGCEHQCTGCYNINTWDFSKGIEFTKETEDLIVHMLTKDNIHKNLSVLGGESLSPNKINVLTKLFKRVKNLNKNIQIWVWTGYLWEEVKNIDIIKYIDVLIDGRYEKELHNPTRYKGSDNQRVIDVKNSLVHDKVVIHV